MAVSGALSGPPASRSRRPRGLLGGTLAAGIGLAAVWQFASFFFPPFLFPGVDKIAVEVWTVIVDPVHLVDAVATAIRILAGLAGAFLLGSAVAVAMHRWAAFDRYASPLLTFNQGIPALSWVVISIIWFKPIEFRILFIMVMTTLPAFTFQILDGLRGASKDLAEMAMSFRPTRLDFFRTLVLPQVVPHVLTAWKVNLGNAARVVVVAELVGATNGVGYELMQSQQLFDMAGAIAWTLVLVAFVVGTQQAIALVERRVLRWRPRMERAQ